MRFSSRLPSLLGISPIADALRAIRGDVEDLTLSNPTQCGISAMQNIAAESFFPPVDAVYTPASLGRKEARQALTEATGAPAEHIVLTASTSEAYSMLFRVFCDAGEGIAVPRPGYPLFDHLAALDAVRTLSYRLEYTDGRWRLDRASLDAVVRAGARMVVSVQPGNPTGACLTPSEMHFVASLCADAGIPWISDEVFLPYGYAGALDGAADFVRSRASGRGAKQGMPLLIVLDGLSKRCAMPQLKLSWMSLHGNASAMSALLPRLAFAADTSLSVSDPVQAALPTLLRGGEAAGVAILERVRANRIALTELLACCPEVSMLAADGAWSAVLRLPRLAPKLCEDDDWVLHIAHRARVLVQPGYFYDIEVPGHIVLSLLIPPERFRVAICRMTAVIGAAVAAV